eukprot:TRINITY_DN70906_c0_g1_i1.p1 TRINITY_DN70906_c0_g1~~TRINITY_DN70906_c0_g1_i1.p1  ORF type:complete len:774 (+),score=121.79 TRINITY_DN70906_c0_g1_i1:6250-8571(+)
MNQFKYQLAQGMNTVQPPSKHIQLMAKLISSEKIPAELKSKLNPVKRRVLFLSPSVASGHEHEPRKEDFEALTSATIGTGGFGKVYKVRHKVSKNVYAIKVINKSKIIESNLCEQMRLEVRIMYSLNHEHIIKLYNHFEDDDHFYLVLEFAPKGHLYEKLKMMGRLTEKLAAQYMREVFSAVEYLHSTNPPIIHRDIKPENILLDAKECAKLCDFGWSNFFNPDSKRMTYCGTPDYLSPEMIKKEGHDQHVDLWNLGVLLFELLTGRPPFQGSDQKELFANILKLRINFPKDFPKLAKDLVTRMLKVVPKERISLKAALEHPWFKTNAEIRPVLTRAVKMEKQLPTLEHDLEEEDFEPVSRVSKVNREIEEDKRMGPATKLKIDPIHIATVKKTEKDGLVTDLSAKLQKTIKEVNDLKVTLQAKTRELEVVKKENEDMKKHLGGSEKGYISPDKQEIRRLNEELQKLKALNKNREQTSQELDRKNSELAERSSQAKLLANELETLKGSNKILEGKLAEANSKLEEMQKKFLSVKGLLKEEKFLKEKSKVELEVKIEELNYRLKSRPTEDEDRENDKTAAEATQECKDILKDIKGHLVNSLNHKKSEETLRKELMAAKRAITELKIKHDNEMHEMELVHQKVLSELRNKHAKELKDGLEAQDKVVEELEFQLSQYEEQEGKAAMEEHNMKMLQSQNVQLQKIINDLKLQVNLYAREHQLINGKLKTNTMKVQDLELQLSLVKGNSKAQLMILLIEGSSLLLCYRLTHDQFILYA